MNADTRNKIVETAKELFWQKGYNSTSIADILSRTQVHSGSLYHFFPGKQDLLIGVLESHSERIGPDLLDYAWHGIDDPIDKIFALLGGYRTALLTTECSFGCPIGSLALELHEPDPKVRALMAENFDNWTRAIEGCLEDAADRFPPDTERRALAEFVLTTMEGAVMQCRTQRDIGFFDRSIAMLREHISMLMERAKSPA